MKIWRKESTKPIKDEKKEEAVEEEFTDISQASTPKPNSNKSDKMEEIYSTKDKQVKYKRLTPLEAEEAAKRTRSAKEKLASGKAEIALDTPEIDSAVVELTSEFEEGTVIADDIVEDATPLARYVSIEDIDDIDIDLGPLAAIKKYEQQVNSTTRQTERQKPKLPKGDFERIFGKPKLDTSGERIVTKIPTYQHESKINKIVLKAGRFSDVVESEYDEYLKSNDPIISTKADSINRSIDFRQSLLYTLSQRATHKNAEDKKSSEKSAKPTKPVKEKATKNEKEAFEEEAVVKKKPKNKIKKFFRILGKLIFTKKVSTHQPNDDSQPSMPDYKKHQDAHEVSIELNGNYKMLLFKTILLSLVFLASLTLTVMESIMGKNIFMGVPFSPLIYCVANLLMLIFSGFMCRQFIIGGLKPLKNIKGNSDTAVACAMIACTIQQLTALFFSDKFLGDKMHLYTTIVLFALTLNLMGRTFMVSRIRSNFKFITSKSPAYCGEIYKDEDAARKMLGGTMASRSYIAYQHPTNFLSDFLKISYAPDPSEELAGKFAPITVICSLAVSIIYGIIFKTVLGALTALVIMCCISIPLCALLAGNIPMKMMCKNALKENAMISGYPSVKQFSESSAVMVSAMDLYPKGCVKLCTSKNYVEFRVEESLLYAATVLKESQSPLCYTFEKLLKKYAHTLPDVESIMYEDKLGLVAWVNGERVLIGNRALLDRYHVFVEDTSIEAKYKNTNKDITYIACSGQLISVIVTKYSPSKKMKDKLYKAESNGLNILVTTTDSNITQDKVAEDYELYYRCVKVLGTGFANDCVSARKRKEETSRAFLATRGKTYSLIHAVTGCITTKNNMTIGLIIQIFGLILGVLLGATMILYATVSILGVLEMLLYMLFWGAATIAVQLIKRS
ncbi:MAG: hypothetical protein IKB73_04320 [Ruminococcus sp.]|nr:hypothetical protein [Ruminococcus sp.]